MTKNNNKVCGGARIISEPGQNFNRKSIIHNTDTRFDIHLGIKEVYLSRQSNKTNLNQRNPIQECQ
jgi:hypothetical protein